MIRLQYQLMRTLVETHNLNRQSGVRYFSKRLSKVGNSPTAIRHLATVATDNSDLIITKRCATQLNKVCDSDEHLRITVDSGGCSGFEYKFLLDSKFDPENDIVFDKDGGKVVVDTLSLELLRGSTIDFETELIRSSFRIAVNPNAEQGCSCGASFALKQN